MIRIFFRITVLQKGDFKMKRIGITGYRPSKLDWGYDYSDRRYQLLQNHLCVNIASIANHEPDRTVEMITGMALGVDTIFALSAITLKQLGYNIHLTAAIPFAGQESKWPDISQKLYYQILDQCNTKVIVSDGTYAAYKLQKRNEWIVDHCDQLFAVYHSGKGGTYNCIQYAKQKHKSIILFDPLIYHDFFSTTV